MSSLFDGPDGSADRLIWSAQTKAGDGYRLVAFQVFSLGIRIQALDDSQPGLSQQVGSVDLLFPDCRSLGEYLIWMADLNEKKPTSDDTDE